MSNRESFTFLKKLVLKILVQNGVKQRHENGAKNKKPEDPPQ